MEPKDTLTDDRLKTPRAAAVRASCFRCCSFISLVLIRTTVPADLQDAGRCLPDT